MDAVNMRLHLRLHFVLVVGLVAAAAACASAPGVPTAAPAATSGAASTATTRQPATAPATRIAPRTATRTATAAPAPLTPLPGGVGGAEAAANRALADLAQRLGVPEAGIEVISVTPAELALPDLGCPQTKATESAVIPAFVMGWVIQLRASGQMHEYHAHGAQLAYCGG